MQQVETSAFPADWPEREHEVGQHFSTFCSQWRPRQKLSGGFLVIGQHCLNFLPLLQGQVELPPRVLNCDEFGVCNSLWATAVSSHFYSVEAECVESCGWPGSTCFNTTGEAVCLPGAKSESQPVSHRFGKVTAYLPLPSWRLAARGGLLRFLLRVPIRGSGLGLGVLPRTAPLQM